MKILIVDDSRFLRATVRKELEIGGYVVIEAPGGPEALSILKDHKFDLIILDVEMPRLDGFETCKAIKSLEVPHAAEIPIIFFSSRDTFKNRKKGAEVGALDFFSKEFESGELLSAINNILKSEQNYTNTQVLIITSNVILKKSILGIIEHFSIKSICISDPKLAIDSYNKNINEITMIFIDKDLPENKGLEVLKYVRKTQGDKILPINILIDNFFEDDEILKYINAEATDYFSGPIIKEVFISRIHAQLRSYSVQKGVIFNYKKLMKINELKDQFLSVFSNDLTTPLYQIIKNTESLIKKEKDAKRSSILNENLSLNNFILENLENLLEFRKIEIEEDFIFSYINFSEEILPHLNKKAEESKLRGIELKINYNFKSKIQLLADRYSILRAFNQFIGYGLRYTPKGGTIKIDMEINAKQFLVISMSEINDEINSDTMKHIQTENIKTIYQEVQGTIDPILTLAMIEFIAKGHNGELIQKSGKSGNRYSILIPINLID